MPKINHIHKYERVEVGKKNWIIYRCTLPNCSHFLPTASLIVNKESLCWGLCGDVTIYTQEDFNQKLKKPMCGSCRELRKAQRENTAIIPVVEESL